MSVKSALLTAGALLTVLSLVACSDSSQTTTTPSPTAADKSTSASPVETPTKEPVAPWQSFTTDDGVFSFEHPSEWSVDATRPETAPADLNSWDINVNDGSGATVASLMSGGSGMGGACGGEPTAPITVLDSQDLGLPKGTSTSTQGAASPHFQFTALEFPDKIVTSVGITDSANQTESCMFLALFSSPDTSLALIGFADQIVVNASSSNSALVPTFTSIDEAKAFMDTDSYKNLKRMITSLKIAP